ncbi:hypothetical protein E3N88_08513 [Mikania micrantha]|uniref:Rapid ALkalinization Factor n=1 Tax=Mikania micrantha TaxID=192012 RepID=A0A5N6PHD6_9ASTR|nr:hypothetical protein E3N88_08513 [Mikania micrantha]
MSKSAGFLMICTLILAIDMITISFPAVNAASIAGNHQISWIPATTGVGCRGSMAECLTERMDVDFDDMEFSMDSESTRRILANYRRYISYGALSRNNVPCSRRGASYYNCRSGGFQRQCWVVRRALDVVLQEQ